jgi:hypothetical protein
MADDEPDFSQRSIDRWASRIRREPYTFWIGDVGIDADELRSYALVSKLEPAVACLTPPITAAETVLLAQAVSLYAWPAYVVQEYFRMILRCLEPWEQAARPGSMT